MPVASYKEDLALSFKDDIKELKKLWPYFEGHKLSLWISLILMPLVSALQIYQPMMLMQGIDEGVLGNNPTVLYKSAAAFIIFVLLEYVFRLSQSVLSSFAVQFMIMNLRQKLVAHVMRLSSRFHDQSLSGVLVTRTTSDFDQLSESLNQGVLQSLIDIVVFVGSLIGMFLLNVKLALIVTISLPFTIWCVEIFAQKIKVSTLAARSHLAKSNAFAQECFLGAATIKTLGAEDHAGRIFEQHSQSFRDSQITSVSYDALLYSFLDGMSSVMLGTILWLMLAFFLNDPLSAGLVVAFVRYLQQLYEPIKQMGSTIAVLQGAFAAIIRIFQLFETKETISGNLAPVLTQGHVIFENVSFSYHSSEKMVLKNLSFELKPKTSLAIVGRTGSGKSTIAKLLAKMYEGYQGRILIDGQDIKDLDPFLLRKQIAFIPQDVVLFDESLRFNIALNREGVTDRQIKKALIAIGGEHILDSLKDGLDAPIKEGGSNLSHGQRQLIAFARALVLEPKLMILDEATSQIDPETEKMIQKSIEGLLADRSVIIIAHRLATIEHCNQVLDLMSC